MGYLPIDPGFGGIGRQLLGTLLRLSLKYLFPVILAVVLWHYPMASWICLGLIPWRTIYIEVR